jgi:hypothetical protein
MGEGNTDFIGGGDGSPPPGILKSEGKMGTWPVVVEELREQLRETARRIISDPRPGDEEFAQAGGEQEIFGTLVLRFDVLLSSVRAALEGIESKRLTVDQVYDTLSPPFSEAKNRHATGKIIRSPEWRKLCNVPGFIETIERCARRNREKR